MEAATARSWYTVSMPWARALCGPEKAMGSPPSRISPASGVTAPVRALIRLVFAGAVVADDGEDLAGEQVEVGAVDGGDLAVPLDQAAGLQHGRGGGCGGHRAFFRESWSTVTARITRTPVIRVW